MTGNGADIAFYAAQPRGGIISAVLIGLAALFAGLAYLLHCDGLICQSLPGETNEIVVLFILIALALVIAWFVRPAQSERNGLLIAGDHLMLTTNSADFSQRGRTIPFSSIKGLRHQPGLHSRGILMVDLVSDETSSAPYVAIPLDGLNGRASRVFDSIHHALEKAGYRVDGASFKPALFMFEKSWTLVPTGPEAD